MALVATDLEPARLQRNEDEFSIVTKIAESGEDHPVLMLNMNRYTPDSDFPNGKPYKDYIAGLEKFLAGVGAKILWRTPVLGLAVGDRKVDEILAVWYPLHRLFVDLYVSPGAEENFRLKGLCVEYAMIHRCPGDRFPLAPAAGAS